MNHNDDELRKLQSILEEKDRDLLLSASIGKELLEKNTKLEDKIVDLQGELRGANENLEQLSYQLCQKNDLINILTSDDECGSENGELDFGSGDGHQSITMQSHELLMIPFSRPLQRPQPPRNQLT
jgi:hypothetical protein